MKSEKFINVIIVASIIASVLCVVFGVLEWHSGYREFFQQKVASDDSSNWGNYGSFLQGATASLWALAGFFIIFVAFLIQNKQLVEQRQQFVRQNFENNFFQLINLHHKLVEDMVDGISTGRDCFEFWYNQKLMNNYWSLKNPHNLSSDVPELAPKRELEITVEAYDKLYKYKQGDLGHYFRNLYHIIKFVDKSDEIDHNLKRKYVTLVRAQLSAYEQVLLFYNCVHPQSEEFYIYVERYGLFHNFNDALLLDESHENYFKPSAYETSNRPKIPNPRLEQIRNS